MLCRAPARRARARWLPAYGLLNAGDLTAAERLTAEALAAFHTVGDRWGVAAALVHELGDRRGRCQSLGPLASLARDRRRPRGDRPYPPGRPARRGGVGPRSRDRLPALRTRQARPRAGDLARAGDLRTRVRRTAAEHGYRFGEIRARLGLALGARRAGDPDPAEVYPLRDAAFERRP